MAVAEPVVQVEAREDVGVSTTPPTAEMEEAALQESVGVPGRGWV